MAIPEDLNSKFHDALIESTTTPGQTGLVILDSTGADISGGGGTSDVNLTEVGGAAIALGQALAAASLPVVLASNAALPVGANKIGAVELQTSGGSTAAEIMTDGADGVSNAFNQLITAAIGYAYNGATFDRLRSGAGNIGTGVLRVIRAGAGTGTVTSVDDTASSTQLLAANASRLKYSVFNNSTEILYLKNGTTASLTDFTVAIPPANQYGFYEDEHYTGRVDGIWANNAAGAALITEYT